MEIKGIKEAVEEFNNWKGSAKIFFDESDNSIWTNIYNNPSETNVYRSTEIYEILSKGKYDMRTYDDQTSIKNLTKIINEKEYGLDSFWG